MFNMDLICEICGKRRATAQVLLEGAILSACRPCGKSGKFLHSLRELEAPKELPKTEVKEEEEIVENWGEIIRKTRQDKGWTIEKLASEAREAISYMHAIESGRVKPTLKTAKKLEKILGIKLIEKPLGSATMNMTFKNPKEITLADLLEE